MGNGIESVCQVCPELRDHIFALVDYQEVLKNQKLELEDNNAGLYQKIIELQCADMCSCSINDFLNTMLTITVLVLYSLTIQYNLLCD